jgi:hypothetical protein
MGPLNGFCRFIVVGGSPTNYQNNTAHDIRLTGGMDNLIGSVSSLRRYAPGLFAVQCGPQ